MGTSERLKQESAILEQIRTSLSLAGAILDKDAQSYLENPLQKIVYTSSPTSTGLRLYQAMSENPGTPLEEVKKQVMKANIEDGIQLGEELSQRGFINIIVPGKFFAEGWTQEHYMSLWEQVINRFAQVICFNDGWQYSTGCVEEFLIGLQKGKEMIGRDLRSINPHEEIRNIRASIDYIDELGLEPGRLYDIYRRTALYVDSLPVVTTLNSSYSNLVS